MKHLKLFFALFAMLALGVGNAWGAETLYKNALFKSANCTKNSSYTGKVTCTIGADSWVAQNAANNNGGWDYVKIGAKKASGETNKVTTGTITTSNAYTEPITKIVVNGKKDRGSFTSKLIIASNNTFTTDKVEISGATSFTNNQITFSIPSPSANKFYKLEFVCTNTSTTNGVIQVSSVEYYYEPSSEETVVSVPTFSVPEGTFYSPINVELSCSTADAEIHYTLDGSTPTSTSEKYSTAIAISETTTVKAIAVKDGLTNSEVATATYTKGETVTSYDINFETNALEAYVNWDFSNITIAKTITAKGGTYYGNTSGKASASIKTKEKIQYPGILTFSVSKETNNETASSWKVQVSENGSTWTDVKSWSAADMSKGAWKDYSVDLSDYENVHVQIYYGSSTAVRAIDEISLAQGVAPVKYTLTIDNPENGTLSVTKGGVSVESGDEFKAGTSLVVTPTPNPSYVFESLTVDGTPVDLTEGSYNLTMPAADVTISATFKESAKPDATLTLSKNGETEDITGYKQDDKVILPSITSDCVKEFVGWSADANCATEPEYKAGDEYTLTSTTQTLYAVYATVGGGGEATAANTLSSNGWANESKHTSLQIDENVKAEITGTGLSNSGKYYTSGTNWRLYQNENPNLTISTTIGELKSVKFTFTNDKTGTLLYNGTKLTSGTAVEVSGTSATFTIGNSSADVTNGQIRISKIEVVYTGGVSYSEYSTECVAALDEPVFSVEGGENEAKTITLTATEGTIYYTLDGTTPDSESTKYTTPIVLDECGEHTIKAIAISSDSESPVASATYTIDLPIPANSETDPYTVTEAVEVYNGGCYDGAELVYVKGTVKTATFYSSGTYTITLTNGFQFYKFYKTAGKELFTDGAINAGDVLVACGKLSKYNTTYQLAEGCYLVAHEPYTEPKVDISNDEASAYTVDKAFELIGDPSSDLTKEVYVKGLVAVAPTSNPTADGQMTYKISDNGENTGNVLTVYLGLNLNGEKFTSKNDVQQGDYVVVKGKLLDYNGTYELNKGNQLVQHKKAATITIADITMEVGETKTIAATVVPAEATVTYTIKENAANAISLSGNVITANEVGTATITATIETAAGYMGKTVDFTVTVNAKSTKEKVVILAEYEGQWYAMKAQYVTDKTSHLAPLPVTYFEGKLYDVDEAEKALIEWERVVVDGKATFFNNSKYLTGKSDKTDLTLAATACEWTISGDSYLIGARTFLYNAENNWFRNFGTSNAGNKNYSGMPTVTAPVYATGDIVYTRNVTNKYGTICLPYASQSTSGAIFFAVVGKESGKVYLGSVEALEAGVPYIFLASGNSISVTLTGAAKAAGSNNGLYGTFADETVVEEGYILQNNELRPSDGTAKVNAYRAYLVMDEVDGGVPQQMPGRRYVSMSVTGENEATGFENITTTDTPVKVIENGQLIIIRNGEKFNAQGQRL